jgi:hypothetical protein
VSFAFGRYGVEVCNAATGTNDARRFNNYVVSSDSEDTSDFYWVKLLNTP